MKDYAQTSATHFVRKSVVFFSRFVWPVPVCVACAQPLDVNGDVEGVWEREHRYMTKIFWVHGRGAFLSPCGLQQGPAKAHPVAKQTPVKFYSLAQDDVEDDTRHDHFQGCWAFFAEFQACFKLECCFFFPSLLLPEVVLLGRFTPQHRSAVTRLNCHTTAQ
mmetsp:Transcript_67518/g.113121  ORF Transcript_67518/g.113121 Transcript_67518/m.113121 type:complete len:162 (+) Transcript_67518:217-702(+)